MKTLISTLLASSAVVFAVSAASAADLPRRTMAPAPYVAAVPVFTWTGFYVGVNAGYGWSDNDLDDGILLDSDARGIGFGGGAGRREGVIAFRDRGSEAEGFLGGVQIGYNWQVTPGAGFVWGVEADIQGIDLDRDRRRTDFVFTPDVAGTPDFVGVGVGNPGAFFREDAASLDWFGTVRGRLGYAFDRFLVYGTGGLAYGSGDRSDNCSNARFRPAGFNCQGFGDDGTRWGYAVGGGFEWALPVSTVSFFGSTAVTFGVEALYVNLDEDGDDRRLRTVGFREDGTEIVGLRSVNNDLDFGLVRAKLNFKF
jgi:outer membrane immunogenic protein